MSCCLFIYLTLPKNMLHMTYTRHIKTDDRNTLQLSAITATLWSLQIRLYFPVRPLFQITRERAVVHSVIHYDPLFHEIDSRYKYPFTHVSTECFGFFVCRNESQDINYILKRIKTTIHALS